MKRTKFLTGLICIILSALFTVGCKKAVDTETKKVAVKSSVTSKSIIDKVIEKYKEKPLSDIRLEANNKLYVDKTKTMDIVMVFHNYFIDNDVKKCITNLNFKLIVDKTKNHINMYMNEYGNIGYALNNKVYYSADDMYGMLGIKYSAPELKIEEVIPTDAVSPTQDIYKIDEDFTEEDEVEEEIDATQDTEVDIDDIDLFSEEDEDNLDMDSEKEEEETTPKLRKTYTIDHLSRLSDRVMLKGNKEIDSKECYVLKGIIDSVEIRNILVTYLESGLYTIPKDIGDVEFDVYVDKDSYEIHGVTFNCGKVISTLSGNEEIKNNLLEFKVTYNTGAKLTFPKVRESTVDCYDTVLTAIDNISKSFK